MVTASFSDGLSSYHSSGELSPNPQRFSAPASSYSQLGGPGAQCDCVTAATAVPQQVVLAPTGLLTPGAATCTGKCRRGLLGFLPVNSSGTVGLSARRRSHLKHELNGVWEWFSLLRKEGLGWLYWHKG